MVIQRQPATARPVPSPRSTEISLGEVVRGGLRLEAASYNITARNAMRVLQSSGLTLTALYGPDGLCHEAHNAFRFRRIYVEPGHGIPFLSSSDIIRMRRDAEQFISRKLTKQLDRLLVKQWDILISRSGTVGNVALASAIFAGSALSEHVIRLRAPNAETSGFVAAFLRSRYGRLQLTSASYGSVVTHIEPSHLTRVLIPLLAPHIQNQLGHLMVEAGSERDRADTLLNAADNELHRVGNLPSMANLEQAVAGPAIRRTRLSELSPQTGSRFDASFHSPSVHAVVDALESRAITTLPLTDPAVSADILAVTKFRKRVFVPTGGIPMLSSKQLMQIDPIDVKRLAKGAHTKDLPEITLRESMVAVSRSGTIGRVQIIPAYMHGWAASEDVIRVIAAPNMNPGFVYAWLASDYGQLLVRSQAYGSVILHIDREMLGSVPVPMLDPAIHDEIGNRVLEANRLRDRAWRLEQHAIRSIEAIVERRPAPTGP